MQKRAIAMAAAAMLAACDRSGSGGRNGEVASCQDSLTGTWIRERGAGEPTGEPTGGLGAAEERWAILDHKNRLEIYPLFDDLAATAAEDARAQIERSPRSLELLRSRISLLGHVERWVMKRGEKCVIRGNARISGCGSDERGAYLEAQLVELPAPTTDEDIAACAQGPRALPRPGQRWRRAE